MKKKFINGLLIVALFVGFTSSMVSCKDYDDEKITDLEGVLADNVAALKKALSDQKTYIDTEITRVENLITTCQTTCKTEREKIWTALKDYYTKKQVDSLDNILLNEIITRTSKPAVAQTVAELLIEGKNVMTTALDNYITNYNQLNGIVDSTVIRKMLTDEVIKLNVAIDQARALAESGLKLAERDSVRIDGLDKLVKSLQGDVLKLREDVDKATTTANNAWALANTDSVLIVKLRADLTTLDSKVDDNYRELKDSIDRKQEKIDALEDKVNEYKAEADSIHAALLDKITGVEEDLSNFIAAVQEFAEEVYGYIDELYLYLGFTYDYITKEITGIEINGTYNPMFGELALPFNIRSNMLVVFRGEISDRGLQFPSRAQHLAALPDQWSVGNFTDEDLNILGLSSLSKVKGYVNIGENEEIVANQYVDEDGETQVKEGNAGTIYLTVNPTNRDFTGTDFYLINSLNDSIPAALSPLKKSDHKLTFGYTRAGVDDGEDGELQSDNGFYETQVTVDAENAKKMALRVDLDKLKNVAETFKNYENGISLTTVMDGIYSNINNVLDACALKADWVPSFYLQDYDFELPVPFSTVSQYAIGVAGVKPLSFSFAKDIHLNGLPGTQQAENLLSNMIDVIVKGLPQMDFINRFSIERLELGDLDYNKEEAWLYATIIVHLGDRNIQSTGPKTATFLFPEYTIIGGTEADPDKPWIFHITNTHPEVTVEVHDAEDTDGNGKINGDATITLHWNIYDFITSMGRYDTEDFENIKVQFNQLLDQVNSFIGTITTLNFSNMGRSVLGQFQDFINELNSHFVRFTEPNRFFQPAVVVKNQKGMVHLSRLANYPTKVEGTTVAIIPTNFNAEMLSPAFKKFIAVTDVKKAGKSAKGGDADCKSVLEEANKTAGFMEVIDGGFNPISFTGKAGYSYEFIYSAVDFSGKIATRKFYMTVK